MLHKPEEWKVIGHAPKIKMMKEHGRHLRLDDEAERKLTMGGLACNWRPRTRDLFRYIVILMHDTGMRNERELFRMRIENLDWQNRVIFLPESKTGCLQSPTSVLGGVLAEHTGTLTKSRVVANAIGQ